MIFWKLFAVLALIDCTVYAIGVKENDAVAAVLFNAASAKALNTTETSPIQNAASKTESHSKHHGKDPKGTQAVDAASKILKNASGKPSSKDSSGLDPHLTPKSSHGSHHHHKHHHKDTQEVRSSPDGMSSVSLSGDGGSAGALTSSYPAAAGGYGAYPNYSDSLAPASAYAGFYPDGEASAGASPGLESGISISSNDPEFSDDDDDDDEAKALAPPRHPHSHHKGHHTSHHHGNVKSWEGEVPLKNGKANWQVERSVSGPGSFGSVKMSSVSGPDYAPPPPRHNHEFPPHHHHHHHHHNPPISATSAQQPSPYNVSPHRHSPHHGAADGQQLKGISGKGGEGMAEGWRHENANGYWIKELAKVATHEINVALKMPHRMKLLKVFQARSQVSNGNLYKVEMEIAPTNCKMYSNHMVPDERCQIQACSDRKICHAEIVLTDETGEEFLKDYSCFNIKPPYLC